MQIEDYLSYRHLLFTEHDRYKGTKKGRSLEFQIASISETIAEEYAKLGNKELAVAGYLTQSEYLFNLGRVEEGKAALEKAKTLTESDKIRKWIDETLTCQDPK